MGRSDGRFLLNVNELTEHFAELQNKAKSIRVAVAWATQGKALDTLCNAKCRVETIVGTGFNATDPEAIENLQRLGPVRVDERRDGSIFHPKFYLFQLNSHYEVIIGSPNLSDAAFSRNEEAAVRMSLNEDMLQQLLNHFEKLRKCTREVTKRWLIKYRSRYNRSLSARKGRSIQEIEGPQSWQKGHKAGTTVGKLLTYSWQDYFDALINLSDPDGDDRIFNTTSPEGSYLKTLDILASILKRPFNTIQGEDFRRLIGARESIPDAGWFGSLTAGGRLVRQLETNPKLRRLITRNLHTVRKARTDAQVLDASRDFFEGMTKYKYVKHAAVTRLLAIYRPDRFFSLNNKSIRKFAGLFNIPQSQLKKWDGYSEALRIIWNAKWWNTQKPKSVKASRVWDARVALLDLYAYEP